MIIENKSDIQVVEIQKVTQGVSTDVYRINPKTENLYLRIQPEKEFAYSQVVFTHKLAIEKEIKVPEVVDSEDFSEDFDGSSWMLVRSIQGEQTSEITPNNVFFEAGIDIAKFNQIECKGFGWIERSKESKKDILKGSFSTLYEDLTNKLEERLSVYLKRGMINKSEQDNILKLAYLLKKIDSGSPTLTHSDLSYEHIFYRESEYTGIIDFDDIRGSNVFLDLAEISIQLKPDHYQKFLEGYKNIIQISPEQMEYDFRITRLFWFIEKGYWVIDLNPDPQKNRYWKMFMADYEYLSKL